jgi:hypothetical protein
MPVPPELKKKLEQEGIVGVSDPEFGGERKIRVYVETEEDAKKVLMEMPEVKVAGVSVKTEPIVSGRFYALARTERVRPIVGGISLGNYKITAGTLGLIVRDKATKKPLILSNNHVLTQVINGIEGEIEDPILQPGPYDGGTENDIVAKLLRFVTIKLPPETNLVDAAVAEVVEGIDFKEFEIMDVGKVTGIAEAKEGERVFKSGRTTGLTQSTIFDTRATIKVYGYYSPDNYAIFEDQLISSTPFMAGGDSGSIWVNERGEVVGLGFAGSDKFSCANKIQNVINLLDIEIPTLPKVAGFPVLLPLAIISLIYLATKR